MYYNCKAVTHGCKLQVAAIIWLNLCLLLLNSGYQLRSGTLYHITEPKCSPRI
jgi:hypothetical protein